MYAMSNSVPALTEEEMQALRSDAAANVAGAHAALSGNAEELALWRQKREASSAE